MEVRILGSLEVLVDGREVPLGGARQRAVLAILIAHRGEPVSVDRIVDELWGERAPETATKTVQVYVSRLRKVLGEGALITGGGGYVLEIGAGELDADRFERLAAEGRAALEGGDTRGAADGLRAALELWRGPALADFAYESFAQNEIARLEEERVAALEERATADLALGRHAVLVPELEALVREHPTRERLRGQLMLALYRSGRQTDALDTYRDVQRRLADELGLEPGPELQELERAILEQRPELDAPPTGAAARLRERRRGGALVALGGGVLLAAALAAVVWGGGDGDSAAATPNSVAVIDPGSDEVVDGVPTGVRPAEVAADAEHVWVANKGDDTVTQIDPEKRTVLSTISPQTSIGGLAADEAGVWIADTRREKLVEIDPDFRSVAPPIPLARNPEVLGPSFADPVAVGSGAVWAGASNTRIARVDPERREVVSRIPVGNDPIGIASGAGDVWIVDEIDNTLARIDPASANASISATPVGQGPTAVAVGEGAVWVANTQDGTVTRVDPATASALATIPVGGRPTGIATGEGAVWVTDNLGGIVSRIDPATDEVEAAIEVGEAPQAITVAHGLVWVSVQASVTPPAAPPVAADDEVGRVLLAEDPGPADPALEFEFQRLAATCAQLYSYPDRPFPEGAQLQPEVADGPPEVSDDGLTYTIRIRPGYRFSPPSNEPVTAAAFAHAIERSLHPRTGSFAAEVMDEIAGAPAYTAGRAAGLAGVSAHGDTLTIELSRPAPDLPARLAAPWSCAIPPDTPISSKGVDGVPMAGPYYVASHDPGRSLIMRRNPNYAGPRPQGLEEIRFDIGVPPVQAVAEVEAGRADYAILDPIVLSAAAAVPAAKVRELVEAYGPESEAARAGRQQLFTQPTLSMYSFVFNTERGPFADPRLRRAVNFAVDRRALAAEPGLSQGARATDQYIPPGMAGFEDRAFYPLGGPDLARARRLAGDIHEPAVLYTCTTASCTRHAEILRSNLAAIGVEVEVRQFSISELFSRVGRPGEPFDLTYANWFADYADPFNFTNLLYAPEGIGTTRLDDPDSVRRFEAAARLSGEERLRAYADLDRYLSTRAAPAVPFATGTVTHLFSARMGCQVLHPVWGLDLAALCVRDEAEDD